MKNFYATALMIAALILLIPSRGYAQSDCFESPSGATVIIDYHQGLTGEVKDGKVTLVDPFTMANREFLSLRDSLNYAQGRLNFLRDKFDEAVELADSLESVIDTSNIAYSNACLSDLEQLDRLVTVYMSIDEDIESRLSTRNVKKVKRSSGVVPDLGAFMLDLDYLMWHVEFCEEYLLDLCAEIVESATYCEGQFGDAAFQLDIWSVLIKTLSEKCLEIADYYEEHYFDFDYASLLEFQSSIYTQASGIRDIVDEINHNLELPVDKDFALKYIIAATVSTAEEMNEAFDELSDLQESWNNLAANFMPVLMGFNEGAESGMYVYLMSENGVLRLPSEMTYVDEGGEVTAINGNIFGEDYPNGFPALKSIVIPSTIESIKNKAFAVEGIESVVVEGSAVPELDSDCFTDNVYANAVLYVDESLKDSFISHPSWGRFAKIESLGGSDSVDEIEAGAVDVRIVGMTLYVEAPSGCNVSVWNSNGLKISDNLTRVTLPSKGVYIVRVGNKVVKVSC